MSDERVDLGSLAEENEALRRRVAELEEETAARKALLAEQVAIAAAEEKFRKVFATNLDAFYLARLEDGMVVECTDKFLAIFGYGREEVHGKTPLDVSLYADPNDRTRVLALLGEHGSFADLEVRARRKNGEVFPASLSATILETGDAQHILGIVRDITERKRAEEELRESRHRLEMFAQTTFEGIVESEAGRIVDCNEQTASMLGYSVPELRGMELVSLVLPEDRERVMESIRRGQDSLTEITLVRKNGERIIVEAHGRLVSPGSATRHTAFRDITEHKQLEAEATASRDYLDSLLNAVGNPVFVKDSRHSWVLLNDSFCSLLGHSREELIGRSDVDFFPKGQAEVFWATDDAVLRTGQTDINEELFTDGTGQVRTILTKKTLHTNPQGEKFIVGTITDITERKLNEEALRRNEEWLHLARSAARLGIYDHDLRTGKIESDERARDLLGHAPTAPVIWEMFLSAVHPEDRSAVRAAIDRAHQSQSDFQVEYRLANLRDGRNCWVKATGHGFFVEGQLARQVGTVEDITERRQAEEKLQASEKRLQEIIEHAPISMAVVALDGTIEYFNCKAQTTFGYGPEEIPTMEAWWVQACPDPDYRREVVTLWTGLTAKALAEQKEIESREYRFTCKDGTIKTMLVSGVFVAGKTFVMLEDVTERKQAEESLRRSEERLRGLVENTSDWVWEVDERLVYTYASPRVRDLLGYEPGEILGKSTLELMPQEEARRLAPLISAFVADHKPFRALENKALCRDGREVTLETSGIPFFDADGRLRGYRGIDRDITERKRIATELAHSEEKYRALVEQSLEGIGISKGNEVLYANRALLDIFGYEDRDEFRRVPLHDHVAPTSRERLRALTREDFGKLGSLHFEYQAIRKDGSIRDLELSAVQVAIDGQVLLQTTFKDVTERHRAEEALREADRRKRDFLAVLSHELRNPLTPIRNSLYILERATPGGEQARRAHSVIDRQVSHLAHLVDDLLDVTRISRGKVRLQAERLDLVDAVRRTVDDHRTLLEDREVTVTLPDNAVWIDGDPSRLAQVVGNLLNNAVKFTPVYGKVSVSLTQVGGRAVLEVADTGVGIDSETLKNLFEPFSQSDRSLGRSRGGLGLGLALVKGMVELHGGEVTVHSDGPGRGARFTVELPLAVREPIAEPLPQRQEAASRGRKVLVIEDNKDAANSLSEALGLAGHQVAVAYDGDAGLAAASEIHPEIVLCDIGLPGDADGYAVARALRNDPMTATTYLVALTGYAQPEDQRRALEAGFDAHMSKPPDLAALERLLAQVPIGGTRAGDEAAPPA